MSSVNIARIARSVAGMREEQVADSADAWRRGRRALDRTAGDLRRTGQALRQEGFGPRTAIGEQSELVFQRIHDDLLARSEKMGRAEGALRDVAAVMGDTRTEHGTMPDTTPGPPPPRTGGPFEDEIERIHAAKVDAGRRQAWQARVTAYDRADERARIQADELDRAMDEAAAVFAALDELPAPLPTLPEVPIGGEPRPPATVRTNSAGVLDDGRRHDHDDHDRDPDRDDDTDDTDAPTDPTGADDAGDSTSSDDASDDDRGPASGGVLTGTTGPTVPATTPGGSLGAPASAGLGILGALGLRSVASAATRSGPTPVAGTTPAGALGSSGRAGSGGVLGTRGGGLVPGQAVGRGAGAGVPGRRGGRDGEGRDHEHFDVDEDWTDDEGRFPGVLD